MTRPTVLLAAGILAAVTAVAAPGAAASPGAVAARGTAPAAPAPTPPTTTFVGPAVLATIPVGDYPTGMAVGPGGARLYVANQGGSSVTVIDVASRAVTATIPLPFPPNSIAVSPDGTRAYTASGPGDCITVIDTVTGSVLANHPVGDWPTSIALDATGTRAFVAVANPLPQPPSTASSTGFVQAVDLPGGTVAWTALTSMGPAHLTVSEASGLVYDASYRLLSTIDPVTGQVYRATAMDWMMGARISATIDGAHLVVKPEGTFSVQVLDTGSGQVEGEVMLFHEAASVVAVATRAYLAVTAQEDGMETRGLVSVIDPIRARHIGTYEVGSLATLVAVDRAHGILFVADALHDVVSLVTVAPALPSRPRRVRAWYTSSASVRLSWRAPTTPGDARITGYVVTSHPDDVRCTTRASKRACTVKGLNPDEGYRFQVQARTAAGLGAQAVSRLMTRG